MHTSQSARSRWTRYNARPGAHARRKAAREAASIAGPAPAYPPDAPVHGDWLGVDDKDTATVRYECAQERGPWAVGISFSTWRS